MNVIDAIVLSLAAPTGYAYLCRLDALRYGRHKVKVVVLHVALFACAGWAGVSAMYSDVTLQGIAGLIASIMWIWVSIPSWKNGVPSHVTKAEPLAPKHWPEITGRGKP